MRFLGNLIWFLLGGFIWGLVLLLDGVILCATVIFIPFGKQCFKLARLAFWPFGKIIDIDFDMHPYLNILWAVVNCGLAFISFLLGILLCITIIGIPFGKQWFKIARLSAAPFGAIVIKI